MPTVRYEIRSEFGLGNPELYRATASKDDPEALLEGVAMAGLVGILRQLGDLAEFASEIFHDLHKEVTATATRGHGMMLRVQKVEAEFQALEKAFLCQSSQTHFAYNMGINWRPKLQMDHNLINRESIPLFMTDSYEECRGSPQLFMLDKYDVSGAGACLKRYSDPSFFKIELASSGIVESQVEQEKKVHENKKKGQCGRNGDTPIMISTRQTNSKLQFMTSNQASEELPVTRVKLKFRHLNGSDTTSYMERLRQELSPEENYQSKNSNSCSDIKMGPIASSESISEVDGVSFDASADTEKNPSQSPTMDDACGMERQRIKVKELPQTLPEHEESTEGSADDYLPSEQKVNSSGFQDLDQKEFSSDSDWRTEGSAGGYSSDDIASDVEDYMDALNTIESEVETDCENNVKLNLGFTPITRGMNSGTDDEQELQNQDSRTDLGENSNSVGSISSHNTDISTAHQSYSSRDRSDAQQLQRNRITLDFPANQDTYPDETDDRTEQWRNCEFRLDSLESLLSSGKCNAKEILTSASSEYSEEFFNCSITDSTSSLNQLSSNGGPDNTLSAARNLDGIPSDLSERQDSGMVEVPTSFIEDSPPSLSLLIGGLQESKKQVGEASPGGIHTPVILSFSLSKSPISKQTHGSLEETKNFGASEDDVASPRVEMTHENSNLEPLCDAKESQEPCNLESTKFIPSCSWKEDLHDDMQQSSNVSNFSEDLVHTETVSSFEHLSVQNAIIETDRNHGPYSVFLPATSGFSVCSREERVPENVVLDHNDSEITENSVPMNLTGTDEVCTPYTPPSSLVEEAQLMSAPTISKFELCIPDSSDLSDTKLSNDVCHIMPSKHAQKDIHPIFIEKNCINPYGIDKSFGSDASLCNHQESAREKMVSSSHLLREVGEPFEEAPDLQSGGIPDIISFERYLSLKKDSNQSSPLDTMQSLSESTGKPDSHVLDNDVSFIEFLKLTQMDWLLNVDPLKNEKGFDSKAPFKISHNAKEESSLSPHFVAETINPSEEVQVSSGSNIISSQYENELLRPSDFLPGGQFVEQENDASNSMAAGYKLSQVGSESESRLTISNGMDSPISNTSGCEQRLLDKSVSSPCSYQLHESFLPSNSSIMALLIPPGFPESTSEQSSGQRSCEPDSISPAIDNAFQETIEELPPLPPLPPLEWRMGKLQTGYLTSHLKMTQSSIGRNLFTALSTIDEKRSHGLLTERGGTVEKSNPFTPLRGSEEEMPQCGSLCLERDSRQSVNLSHMDQSGILHLEEPAAHAPDLSFVQSTIEDNNHLYGLQTFSGGKVHPLNPFLSSEDKSSEHSLSVPIPPSENERSQLHQQLSSSELKRSHHCQQGLEEIERPTSPFCTVATPQIECHQPEHNIPGEPVEDNAHDPDNFTIQMVDDEKPKKKLYLLHRPRDPLIEDVASHDKTTLRKVQELLQPTKSKTDESGTLLEQIRNKSLNLKPTGSVKPNLRGPPTNLKIAAILEKANAIRQACIGSDDEGDDDDGGSWSDS